LRSEKTIVTTFRVSCGGRADRTQRVVLVHDGVPEHGHHRVPDELLDRAAVTLERGAHAVEVPGHDRTPRLGVETFGQ